MEFLNEATYVDQADEVIKKLKNKKVYGDKSLLDLITTSKIRNILSMAADIYDNVLQCTGTELNSDIASRIEYLRVKMIYECGRDSDRNKPIKVFIKEEAKLIEYLKLIGNDKKRYILFYRYLEALVAFHRYHGGKD